MLVKKPQTNKITGKDKPSYYKSVNHFNTG